MALTSSITLGNRFAGELPELAVGWQAEEFPDPRLLVLNELLAVDLGLDPAWLREPEGVHRLTHDVLAQHRADRGQPVPATGERRPA